MFIINSTLFESFLKLLFVVSFALYVAFAFVMTRQITIMRKTIITDFSPMFTIVGYIHLLAAILIFFFFLIAL